MKKVKVLYVFWIILIMALVTILTYIGFVYKTKLKPYKDLESNLTESAKKYVELKFLYPEEGEVTIINLEDLMREEILKDFSYNNKECDGYVELSYNGVYNYKSFINCDDYRTKGYEE